MTSLRSLLLLSVLGLSASCSKTESAERSAPPPPPTEKPKIGLCADGGGTDTDALSAGFFPRTALTYCIDPQGEVRTFGEKAKLDMDAVCTTAFDGECAVYAQYGLKRLVALRYVDGAGGAGSAEVYLSQFKDTGGAYGMFTKRVVADADPAEPSTPRPLEAGGAAAIGTGRAYVWKGSYLAELQYNNEEETPEALATSSAKLLPVLAKEIGAKLPGGTEKPRAAELLFKDNLIPNGIAYFPKDAPHLGAAAGAVGFYKDGAKRYRAIAAARDDAAQAKETWSAVRAKPGWLPVPGVGEEACALTVPGEARAEYVFARQGSAVIGIGDEEIIPPGGKAPPDSRLTKDEKIALLKKWVAALPKKS